MTLTPTQRQRRWRANKRQAEIAAGVRPKRKPKSKSAAQIKRAYRAKVAARERAGKYAPSRIWRAASRTGPPIAPDFRVGDCRQVLRDILMNSVALILTDPEYDKDSEPLYRWLADFAMSRLMPGGSLVCYVGETNWHPVGNIFAAAGLTPQRIMWMPHTAERPLLGAHANSRNGGRPVLWFTKGPQRAVGGKVRAVPTMARSSQSPSRSSGQNKLHKFQQGDAVWQWIEPLADKGEWVVDPFCGSGEGGCIAGDMGRKWIGCDINVDLVMWRRLWAKFQAEDTMPTNPLICGFETRLTKLIGEYLSLGLAAPEIRAAIEQHYDAKAALKREIELQITGK